MTKAEKTIRISFYGYSAERSVIPSIGDKIYKVQEVGSSLLRKNLSIFTQELAEIMAQLPETSPWVPRKIEVTAQVTADGGLELVGSLSAGMSGGIKIVFEKEKKKPIKAT